MIFRAAVNSNPDSLAFRMRRKRMEGLGQLIESFPEPVRTLRRVLYTRFRLGWMKRQPDPLLARAEIEQVRLLDAREIRCLFPDAELRGEMLGPLTKSMIAVRFGTRPRSPEISTV
jgi:hypothetical protein